MTFSTANLALAAIIWTIPVATCAAEALTDQDHKELTALYDAFHSDTKVGKQTNYPKYLDPDSLVNFMKVHQAFVRGMLRYATEEQMSGLMRFTPDIQTVLKESDPNKYFSSIEPAGGMKAMAGMANVVNKVVGITGDSSKAFIVVEGFMDGELGKTDPFYSVWPALKTEKGWRLDATSNLVRELRIKVRDIDKQMNPTGK